MDFGSFPAIIQDMSFTAFEVTQELDRHVPAWAESVVTAFVHLDPEADPDPEFLRKFVRQSVQDAVERYMEKTTTPPSGTVYYAANVVRRLVNDELLGTTEDELLDLYHNYCNDNSSQNGT